VTTTAVPGTARDWQRVGWLLFASGWGANHFAPLLLVYRDRLGLDAAALALLFGMYALGLVPGLLVAGPISDRRGRRALVLPSAVVAMGASALLAAFGDRFWALLLGRLLYGLGAGGVMSAGATWLLELSARQSLAAASGTGAGSGAAARDSAAGVGARRATIALSSGFGFGPLFSGLVAQYAPAPTVLPFVLHAALMVAMLAIARGAPDTVARGPAGAANRPLIRIELDRAAWRKFMRGVLPMAPFVFALPTIPTAAIPGMLEHALGSAPIAYTGFLCVLTLFAGVGAQPLTRRLAPATAARLGLAVGAVGVAIGAITVATQTPILLLVVAPVMGAAYGVCMTGGLHMVQRLARPDARGGITGLFYVLTYVGFAAPWLLAMAGRFVAPAIALWVTAAVTTLVAITLPRAPDPAPAGG
jgi:Major Facilitator Superfamily